jgi:DNA-binding transcriptional LysR family regulator
MHGNMNEMKLRRLDMTLLLLLDEVLRRRKLSDAATALGLSAPAVSHALGRLRDIFGDPLFLRHPGGVEPTARCLELAPRVASILAAARAAIAGPEAFDPATAQRIFRLTGLDYEASRFLPSLVARCAQLAPGVRISFRAAVRDAALRALADGGVDVALGFLPRRRPELLGRPLFEETYLVAAAAGHPRLARRKRLDIGLYCELDHVLVSLDGALEGTVDAALAKIGRQRRVVATVPYFLPALMMVAATNTVVTMPAGIVREHAARFGLRAFEPPLPLRAFAVSAVWHRRQAGSGALGWLIDQLAEVAASTTAAARSGSSPGG